MNTDKRTNSQVIDTPIELTESKAFKEVGSAAMFDKYDSGSPGLRSGMSPVVPADQRSRGVEIVSQSSNLIKQSLAAIGNSSDDESDDHASLTNKMVMKINVSKKNLEMVVNQIEQRRDMKDSSDQTQDMEQIRTKLNQSPLNIVFQEGVIENYKVKKVEKDKSNLSIQRKEDNLDMKLPEKTFDQMMQDYQLPGTGGLPADWKPVVCKQTQQFLENTDHRQKSEYKQFTSNVSRTNRHLMARSHNMTLKGGRQRNNNQGQLQKTQKQVTTELNSQSLMAISGQYCLQNKEQEPYVSPRFNNKDRLELSVSPETEESVSFKEVIAKGYMKLHQLHNHLDRQLLSSSRERNKKPIRPLKSSSSADEDQRLLSSDKANADRTNQNIVSSSDYPHLLTPKMQQKQPPGTTGNSPSHQPATSPLILNNGSQANADSALLEDSPGGLRQDEDDEEADPDKNKESENQTETTNNLGQIKVPTLPKNENDVDFLTEGSVQGSVTNERRSTVKYIVKQQTVTTQGMLPMNQSFDNTPLSKLLNKTAYQREKVRKSKDDLMQHGFFPTPPSQGVSEFMRVVAAREHRSTHRVNNIQTTNKFDSQLVNESEQNLSKDLQDVVMLGQHKKSIRHSSVGQSPLLPEMKQKILPKLNLNQNKTFHKLDSKLTGVSPKGDLHQKSVQITTLRKNSNVEMGTTFGLRAFDDENGVTATYANKELSDLRIERSREVSKEKDEAPQYAQVEQKQLQIEEQISPKTKATQVMKPKKALRNEFVLSSKDHLQLQKVLQKTEDGFQQPRKHSIVVKSIQVSETGQIVNMMTTNQEKKFQKQEAITNAKKKALEDRLQNCIEFDNKVDQIMISQPAPIKSRLTQISSSLAAENSQWKTNPASRLASPLSIEAGQNMTVSGLTNQADADTSMSPGKAAIGQSSLPKMFQPVDKQAISGGLSNVGLTITLDQELTPTRVKNNSQCKELEAQLQQQPNGSPIKVRLFDIGGIGEPKSHVLLMQQHPSVQSPHTQSIYFEEAAQGRSQSKLSQQHENRMKLKKLQNPVLNKKSQEVIENPPRNMNEDDDKQSLQQLLLRNRINTSHIRELNTSSAASRAAITKHGSQAELDYKQQQLTKNQQQLSKTTYRLYKQLSHSSHHSNHEHKFGDDLGYNNSSVSPMKQAFKGSQNSDDQILETHSNDTKYFARSKRVSMVGDGGENTLFSLNHDDHTPKNAALKLNQQRSNHSPAYSNIKVVELSHKQTKINQNSRSSKHEFIDYPGKQIVPEIYEEIIRQKTAQKYFRLTTFIDEMFKRRQNGGNPVQSKAHSQQRMKKHTGWSKVLIGCSGGAAGAGKGRVTPTNSMLESDVGQVIQSQRPLPAQDDEVNGRYLSNSRMQNIESKLKQNSLDRHSRYKQQMTENFRELQNRSPVPVSKPEPGFLKSGQARIHPFYHSLVTQNYALLAKQLQDDQEKINSSMLASEHLFQPLKTDTKCTQSLESGFFLASPSSINQDLPNQGDTTDPGLSTQMIASDKTGFQIRSQLSAIRQPTNQVDHLRGSGASLRISQNAVQKGQQQQAESAVLILNNSVSEQSNEISDMRKEEQRYCSPHASRSSRKKTVAVSPLMDKSRQNVVDPREEADGGKQVNEYRVPRHKQVHSSTAKASIVYKQLSKSALQQDKVWNVLKTSNTQRNNNLIIANKLSSSQVGASTTNLPPAQTAATSPLSPQQHTMPKGVQGSEKQINVDLFKDGAALKKSANNQAELEAINASAKFREMRLPPVNVKTAINCKCDKDNPQGQDVESPLLDSIFPVLSPTQQMNYSVTSKHKKLTSGLKTVKTPKQFNFASAAQNGSKSSNYRASQLPSANINSVSLKKKQ